MKGITPTGNIRKTVHTSEYYIMVIIYIFYAKLISIDESNDNDHGDFSLENIEDVVADPVRAQVHTADHLHMLEVLLPFDNNEADDCCRDQRKADTNNEDYEGAIGCLLSVPELLRNGVGGCSHVQDKVRVASGSFHY